MAGLILVGIVAIFGFLQLASAGIINVGLIFGPCGLKQRFGITCPTCGMTTCALLFVQGRIFEAFYIQPAWALICCVLVVAAFFAFITGVFGVYFGFLKRFFNEVRAKYIILALIIIIVAGWLVTLSRELAARF